MRVLHGRQRFPAPLTECSSESDVWEEMMGLKLVGDKGPSFFLMARICSNARKAVGKKRGDQDVLWQESGWTAAQRAAVPPPPRAPRFVVPAGGSRAHAGGRWGSCWPGSAGCLHRCYTGRGGDTAGSRCPGHPTGTPHTRHCYRSLHPQPPGQGDRNSANDTKTFMSPAFCTRQLAQELRQVTRTNLTFSLDFIVYQGHPHTQFHLFWELFVSSSPYELSPGPLGQSELKWPGRPRREGRGQGSTLPGNQVNGAL